jgi:adenosine kinase
MLAALVIETTGPQEYALDHGEFVTRFSDAYGIDAAAEIDSLIPDAG